MYIYDINNTGGIDPIDGSIPKPVKPATEKPPEADQIKPEVDRAELEQSRTEDSRAFQAAKLVLETIPDVRDDKIELALKRLEEGFYDRPEILAETVAGMIADPEANPSLRTLTSEEIETIRNRIESGYYGKEEIRNIIASGIIDDALEG
ncbi:hypothetical protein HQ587_02610 [bacterium]|nr:hypothetical protein [bacterium]